MCCGRQLSRRRSGGSWCCRAGTREGGDEASPRATGQAQEDSGICGSGAGGRGRSSTAGTASGSTCCSARGIKALEAHDAGYGSSSTSCKYSACCCRQPGAAAPSAAGNF
jgi:hypothetical protein